MNQTIPQDQTDRTNRASGINGTGNPFSDPCKKELWDTLLQLNHAWVHGNPDELVNFFHPGMLALTPVDRMLRIGQASCIEGWKNFAENCKIHYFREKDPVIEVYGHAAVVAYYYHTSFELHGQTIESSGRDMFFFVKENGKWWAVADQFSDYPV